MTDIAAESTIKSEEPEDLTAQTGLAVYNIKSLPNDFNVRTLMDFLESGQFEIPPFQRNFVWTRKQASALIESLIMGLPVPQFFLFEGGESQLLIDGQQRLSSIYFFIKGRFPKAEHYGTIRRLSQGKGHKFIDPELLNDDQYFRDFKLQLDSAELKGQSYATLPDKYKNKFDLRTLRTINIYQFEPEASARACSMYEIFHRLNSGGTNLKPQEIRQCIYYSPFYDQLTELNGHELWRALLKDKHSADKNLRDIEFLLRCFALIFEAEYKEPMAQFLNHFSLKAKQNPQQYLKAKEIFVRFLQSFDRIERYNFYNERNRFYVTVLDALFVGWYKVACEGDGERAEPKIPLPKFEQIKETVVTELRQTNLPTTDKRLVQGRIAIAYKALKA